MHPFRHNQSSPVASLPTELLAEIFSLCAQPDESDSSDSGDYVPLLTSESMRMPAILASVNRRWRAVCLAQSRLWSNICITAELVDSVVDATRGLSKLKIDHIPTYLARSRHSPLHILIDGRDPDWDFSEEHVGIDFGATLSPPLFTSRHIYTALCLLAPHLARWKTLTILTDTWQPMYTALSVINPLVYLNGAPNLQSLSLMRCNDYVSYARHFQPRHLREVGFLTPFKDCDRPNHQALPSLKHLSLRGVHADWDRLAHALSSSPLETLELASHANDVRPSMSQLHKLLSSTPSISNLSIVGTGPEGPGSDTDSAHNYEPVHLRNLKEVTVGYRTEVAARAIFHFLDAPGIRSLKLEDTTYPADPVDVNAGPVLSYLGMKACDGNGHHMAGEVLLEKQRKRSVCGHEETPSTPPTLSRGAFPNLEKVTLQGVKSSYQPLRTFFGSLVNVQELKLVRMSVLAVHALLPNSLPLSAPPSPTSSSPPSAPSHPCPTLRFLTINNSDFSLSELEFIVTKLPSARSTMAADGGSDLATLNVHLDPAYVPEFHHIVAAAAASNPDAKINFISSSSAHRSESAEDEMDVGSSEDDESSEDGSLMYDDEEALEQAFRPGGAFNDPVFDAFYAGYIGTGSAAIAAH